MLNSPILDVAISMIFIFCLLSVLTSGVTEFIMSLFSKRGKDLRWSIEMILKDPNNKNWAEMMYDHSMIDGLKETDNSLPTYISADVFSMVLIDLFIEESKEIEFDSTQQTVVYKVTYPSAKYKETLSDEEKAKFGNNEQSYYNFKAGVKQINPGEVQTLLKNFIYRSQDYNELMTNIQLWYNEFQQRASGWYKRKIRKWLFLSGMLIAICMNVDSIFLTKTIYKSKDLREALVKQADAFAQENKSLNDYTGKILDSAIVKQSGQAYDATTIDSLRKLNEQHVKAHFESQANYIRNVYDTIGAMNLPIGWSSLDVIAHRNIKDATRVNELHAALKGKNKVATFVGELKFVIGRNLKEVSFLRILGWIVTGIALSMGAPFWFDALNKLVNLRSSGKKPAG